MTSPPALPPWVAEAAALPLAFAQVREDALIDLDILARLGDGARVLLVASGGCTAAALAALGRPALLHLVDPNPSQLALARLKLRLLHEGPDTRLAFLGHATMAADERTERVAEHLGRLGLAAEAIGPPAIWGQLGPDHAGRYEEVFRALRAALAHQEAGLAELLRLSDPVRQEALAAADAPLGRALDDALDDAMWLPNLVALFSERATRNPVEPFARHFARRTRHALATLPAASNPWLWQMYAGRFPDGVTYPWLSAPAPARLPEVRWSCASMEAALPTVGGFDLVHLSNILDWLAPDEARGLLDSAASALRPGGLVLIRQLNSTLDIPSPGPAFEWLEGEAAELHARDRSFFYRALHLGRKR